jgi:hypothetical protein
MMAVVMPLLVAVLDENSKSEHTLALHNTALDSLNKIGPIFPAAFRTVIMAAPKLKLRLETAIRARVSVAVGLGDPASTFPRLKNPHLRRPRRKRPRRPAKP